MAERESNWDNRLEYAALSDVGMRRSNNQDNLAVVLANDLEAWNERGHLFMVADGMGAHAAGELASKLAVDGVSHLYFKYTDVSPPEALQKAVLETNSEVHRRGQANSDFRNMGTTASALVLLPQGALVAHVGDSRVYRLRADRLEQLTFDHSLLWELRQAGQLTENGDLAQAIPRNVITRSLGPNASVEVDFEGPLPVELDDTFLICSDGLTGKIEDDELASILAYLPPHEAARFLVDLTNLRGGPDNITVVVAKVIKPEMATGVSPGQPVRQASVPMPPAVWVGVAVCLLIALVLMITDRFLPASAAAAVALLVFLSGLIFAHRGRPQRLFGGGKRYGKGPYSVTRRPSVKVAAGLLARVAQNLRQCEAGEDIPLDWSAFDASCHAAADAAAAGQLLDAIQRYARSVRELMEQVRAAQEKKSSDSAIDY